MSGVNNQTFKNSLRKQLQKKITDLTFFEMIAKSGNLIEIFKNQIIDSAEFTSFQGKTIVSFHPFEVEPQINIESEKNDEPYQVSYVRIVDWDAKVMIAAEARRDQPGQWEEFQVSAKNKIHQPTPFQPVCNPDQIAAILVPGMGFSALGDRLGRGAGFYDRFLRNHPEALRIGIAFEEQMTEKIPLDPWDEKVDVILTDQNLYQVISTKLLGEWRSQGKIKNRIS